MGDHGYDYDSNSSFLHCNIPPSSSDEISLLLNQFLYRSSSSTSTPPKAVAVTTTATTNSAVLARVGLQAQTFSSPLEDGSHGPLSKSQRISAGGFLSGNVRLTGVNVSSSSVAVGENETNEDHDCESEEGIEAAVDEGPAKVAPRTKRSRAAEVHNLSEKRRRSRINEKMKALQNLIPNSNKTDKASMLDEAIEYLKQLQLQVQMLTMKNGISLHPMCLPGALQPFQFSQMRTGFGGDNGSGTLTMTQATPTRSLFSLPSQSTATNQLQVSNLINSGTSFGLDSSIQAQFGPFLLRTSSEDICREDMFSNQELNVNHSETNPSDAALLPFNTQDSDLKDSGSLEACVMARSRRESVRSKNLEHNLICTFPTLNWVKVLSLRTGRSLPGDDCKLERNNL